MNTVSTIIVVKDNPPHLFETLDSIDSFSSEIIIANIGIDPNLKKQLLEIHKIKIIEIKESVPYVEIIREKIKQQSKNEYALFLDPDEVLSKQLVEVLKSSMGTYDYVRIPRKNIIFGKWIEHSRWWPDYQIRFFKKDSIVWPTEIHKQPKTTGKGSTLESKEENAIVHYNYESIDEYMQKALRYAKSEASSNSDKKNDLSLHETIRLSISEFMSRFFAYEGYKDGIHGFILAIFQMFYPLLVYFYYLEQTKYSSNLSDKEVLQHTSHFFGKLNKESLFWKNKKDSITLKEKIIQKLSD